MNTILILDTETTGIDPKTNAIIEVGAVLWSIDHACIMATYSELVEGLSNEAEPFNHIDPASLIDAHPYHLIHTALVELSLRADVIVAHFADFDKGFLSAAGFNPAIPWACSNDMPWPEQRGSASLVALALAHGVAVTHAHRALTDCLTLAYLFERMAERKVDIRAMLVHAMRPKARYQALVSYQDRELAKKAGFKWNGDDKTWIRSMATADAEALEFDVKEIPS